MLSEGAVISQFVDAMLAEKIAVDPVDIVADGKFRRIRAIGDKKKDTWYKLVCDDRPAGMFGCNKRYGNGVKFTWKSDQPAKKMTPAERRKLREKMQAKQREREEEDRKRHAAAAELAKRVYDGARDVTGDDHAYLKRKGVRSHGLRVGSWEKLNPKTGELSLIEREALLVPIRDERKTIHSLQAIFPNASNVLGRDKDYLTDGDKRGRFFTIGKPLTVNDKMVVLICEGYATGASLYEACGHCVIIAFDASNLMPVAQVVRDRFPAATIIMCADNDQWTTSPINNPGVTRAREAAKEVGGRVVFPPFADDDGHDDGNGKRKGPTDFNDWAKAHGEESIALMIEAALIDEATGAPVDDVPPWEGDAVELSSGEKVIGEIAAVAAELGDPRIDNMHFTLLGYDRERFFVYNKESKQIAEMTAASLNETGFLTLAPLDWWETEFPGGGKNDGGINKRAAINWFIRAIRSRGIYDASRVRGRGAWMDGARVVYHHGNELSIDGVATPVTAIKSEYVYELRVGMPAPGDEALSDADGIKLVQLAKKFRWSKTASAPLLAGFVMLAPLCGALKWRPHIWLTGGAGCGKSTVLNDYVHPLMGGCDVFANGNSSEAGVRQQLEQDARPVLFDESESNEEGDARRIQNVLSLIRQSSTESDAKTYKGTVGGQSMSFHVRSMFCLASIQVAIKHQADVERLTVLSLRPKREDSAAADNWLALQAELAALEADPGLPSRLLRRGLNLLPIIRQNIRIFTEVAARQFGSQREGDQYGTLLAGAWSLVCDKVVTHEQAAALIDDYDWSEHRDTSEADESERALSALMESTLPHLGTHYTVHEILREAARDPGDSGDGFINIGRPQAEAVLARAGMRVIGTQLLLSNQSQQLREQLKGTPFAADMRGLLLRLPGASRNDQKPVRFSGVLSKCIAIPLAPLLRESEAESGDML
jgi:putative DNA primase/helicase